MKEHLEMKCPYCGEEKVYFTGYLGIGSPNVFCKNCKEEWTESPSMQLHINEELLK